MIFSQDFVGFRLTMLINETNQQGTACSFDLMSPRPCCIIWNS